jgi:16S rRNA (cytidine1402-2'-O)-methyltransferase
MKPNDAHPHASPVLWVVGTPLDESLPLSPEALAAILKSKIIIGENRKVTLNYLKTIRDHLAQKSLYFLDPPRNDVIKEVKEQISTTGPGESVALFSDVGMPILFDPGKEILDFCRKHGFSIHSVVGPTSWGSAAALSGFSPPFFLVGFLPRDLKERERELRKFASSEARCIFMDTPYRFGLLLAGLRQAFGNHHEAFLAWDLSQRSEWLAWGTLSNLEKEANRRQLEKGEFVIITEGKK